SHADRRFRAARFRIPADRAGASPARHVQRADGALGTGLRSGRRFMPLLSANARRRPDRVPLGARTKQKSKRKRSLIVVAATGEARLSRQPEDGRPDIEVSFEFFPPKTDAMEERFWDSLSRLAP